MRSWIFLALIFLSFSNLPSTAPPAQARTIKLQPIKDPRTENLVLDMYRRARELRKADKNVDARLLLEKATEHDPTAMSPFLHEELSRIYHDLGNPNKAVEQALLCLKYDPKQKHVLYNLALYCQEANRFDEAIEFLREYEKSARSEKKEQALSLVTLLKEQKAKSEKYSPDSADYLDQLTAQDNVSHWSADKIPLKVHIEPTSRVKGFNFSYPKLAKESFIVWYKASNKRTPFKFIENSADADITVEWTDQALHVGNEKSERLKAGLTTSTTTGEGVIKHARIQIRTVMPFSKEAEPEDKIKETCLHEVGHALGLNGHSTNPGDIMYVGLTRRQLPALTKRDKSTIARLYKGFKETAMDGVFEAPTIAADQEVETAVTATMANPPQSQTGWLPPQILQPRPQSYASPPPPVYQPVQQPVYQPVQQPVYQPVQQPVYQPVQQPVYQPVQQPVYQPVQQPAYQPVQQPVYQPVQQPGYQPVYQTPYSTMTGQAMPYTQSPYGYAPQTLAPQSAQQTAQPANPLAQWASQILAGGNDVNSQPTGMPQQMGPSSQYQSSPYQASQYPPPQYQPAQQTGILNQIMNFMQPKPPAYQQNPY